MPVVDARYYKTLLICPHRNMSVELAPIVSAGLPLATVQEVKAFPNRKQLVELMKELDPKLCLLDFATDAERAFAVAAEIRTLAPELPIIALLAGNDSDLILRCLRQGADEFLIRPFTSEQFDAAFEKIARLHPAPSSRRLAGAKSIAFIPVKGACGATTLACNLAHQARKLGGSKVLLADLDPLTGTVSFLLKLRSTYSFLDVLGRDSQTVDGELWKQIVVSSQGVDVLLPPENHFEGMDTLPEATPVIEAAQQIYDTVVLDCGNAYGVWNHSIAAACDEIVLVTTNELAMLQATQRLLGWYEHAHVDMSKIRLVINRFSREVGISAEAIASAVGLDVFHTIPSDYESIQKAIMDGKPVPAGSAFGRGVGKLAERLLGGDSSGAGKSTAGGRKMFGLFSRS